MQFDQHKFAEDGVFSPVCNFCFFPLKSQVSVSVWNYVSTFSLIALFNQAVFMLIPCCVYYNVSLTQLEIWDGDTSCIIIPPTVVLLFRIGLAILSFCVFI